MESLLACHPNMRRRLTGRLSSSEARDARTRTRRMPSSGTRSPSSTVMPCHAGRTAMLSASAAGAGAPSEGAQANCAPL